MAAKRKTEKVAEPKKRLIRVSVSTGLVGSDREMAFEVDHNVTDDVIDDWAREVMFEMIDWRWTEVEDGDE
jgi:hypothetical protein